MVTYQKMTFGTGTTAGSITPISAQQYAADYGYLYKSPSYGYMGYNTYYTPPSIYQYTPQYAPVPTTPTSQSSSVPTVTSQKSGTPVIQGKNVSYQTVADLGAIGDTKTVQMPDGSFRNYTRTGTSTYTYTEVRSADNAVITAKSDAGNAVKVVNVSPSSSASSSSSVSTVPLILYEIPNQATVSTSDLTKIGEVVQVLKLDGGVISYVRRSPTQIQYQEHNTDGQIVTPWTSIYQETPTSAPTATLTPSAPTTEESSRPASTALPDLSKPITGDDLPNVGDGKVDHIYSDKDRIVERDSLTTIRYRFHDLYTGLYSEWRSLPSIAEGYVPSAPAAAITQIAPYSEPKKPSLSSIVKPDERLVIQSAVTPGSEGDSASSEDESITEPSDSDESGIDEGLIPDWIENPIVAGYNRAIDPFSRLYNEVFDPEVTIPSREDGVVGGGIKDPVSPSTELPAASAVTAPTPTAPVAGVQPVSSPVPEPAPSADGIPRTDKEKEAATLDWLKTKQDYYRLTDKEVDNLAKYFSPMLPAMTQNGVDLKVVAKNAAVYEGLINGDPEAFERFDYDFLNMVETGGDFKGFESLNKEKQQWVLKEWNEMMIDDGIPAIAQASFNAGVYNHLTRNPRTEDTAEWMRKGGVLDKIKEDPLWVGLNDASNFIRSKEGMAAIGLTFQGLATVGAFMASGPVGAAAVAGTTPFAATELWQTWGDNPFISKQNLQLDANYAWDYSTQHDQLFNNAKSAVDDMGFKANSNDPTANLNLVTIANNALDSLAKSLKDNYVMLQATGTYDSEVQKYDILKDRFESGKSQFSETGEFDKKQYAPSYADLRDIPAGYHVEWNGETRASGDHKIRGGDGSTESTVIAINDATGERIPLGSVKVQPFGQDTIYDVGSAIEKALSYKKNGGSPVEEQHQTLVLNTDPSTTVEINGQVFQRRMENGIDVKKIDVSVPGYYQVKITQADGTVENKRIYIGAGQELSIAEPTRKAEDENYEGFTVHLYEGQKIYINGLESNKYISDGQYIAVPYGAGKYDVRIVNADGSTAYHNPDEYVSDGKMTALPTTLGEDPKQPYQKQSYTSGGSGGGGGSSGGGSGGSSYQAKPADETLIIYGPTCKDADLWQDEVRVYPEIDEPYSISPGYHSIKAERSGYKIWLKTVYCASGDSITVSPAFEPLEVSSEPTEQVDPAFPKRVFINSNPSGGLVLVNGSSSGEWTPCYLDLPEGYYTFTIKKSGYDPYDIVCYVGEVIAWNQQAVELATSRGWI